MVLVLCIGDLHVPTRATDMPPAFKALLMPGKIHHILCPGNASKETYDYLRGICADVHITQGDFDEQRAYPEDAVLSIGEFSIGLLHGHQVEPWGDMQSAAAMQRRMAVDILVIGSTHQFSASKIDGALIINTGSATGAYSSLAPEVIPSFVLIDINGSTAMVYIYELPPAEDSTSRQVKVDKLQFQKSSSASELRAVA